MDFDLLSKFREGFAREITTELIFKAMVLKV
jgi:hypothetical protein